MGRDPSLVHTLGTGSQTANINSRFTVELIKTMPGSAWKRNRCTMQPRDSKRKSPSSHTFASAITTESPLKRRPFLQLGRETWATLVPDGIWRP